MVGPGKPLQCDGTGRLPSRLPPGCTLLVQAVFQKIEEKPTLIFPPFSGRMLPGDNRSQAANITWEISNQAGEKIAQGNFVKDLPVTNCIPAGNIEYPFSGIEKPTQLVVSAEVKETGSKNQWNIWVYPAKQETVDKQPYITSALDNQAMAQLEKGENVLLLLSPGSILPEKGFTKLPCAIFSPAWLLISQVILAACNGFSPKCATSRGTFNVSLFSQTIFGKRTRGTVLL